MGIRFGQVNMAPAPDRFQGHATAWSPRDPHDYVVRGWGVRFVVLQTIHLLLEQITTAFHVRQEFNHEERTTCIRPLNPADGHYFDCVNQGS